MTRGEPGEPRNGPTLPTSCSGSPGTESRPALSSWWPILGHVCLHLTSTGPRWPIWLRFGQILAQMWPLAKFRPNLATFGKHRNELSISQNWANVGRGSVPGAVVLQLLGRFGARRGLLSGLSLCRHQPFQCRRHLNSRALVCVPATCNVAWSDKYFAHLPASRPEIPPELLENRAP